MTPNAAELLDLINELVKALEFDPENCDFGPAYGLGMEHRKKTMAKARGMLRQTNFTKVKAAQKKPTRNHWPAPMI